MSGAGRLLFDVCERCDLAVAACATFIVPLIVAVTLATFRLSHSFLRRIGVTFSDGLLLRSIHLPLLFCFIAFVILRISGELLMCSSSTSHLFRVRLCMAASCQVLFYINQAEAILCGLNACAFKSIRFKRRLRIATRGSEAVWCALVASWTICGFVMLASEVGTGLAREASSPCSLE